MKVLLGAALIFLPVTYTVASSVSAGSMDTENDPLEAARRAVARAHAEADAKSEAVVKQEPSNGRALTPKSACQSLVAAEKQEAVGEKQVDEENPELAFARLVAAVAAEHDSQTFQV